MKPVMVTTAHRGVFGGLVPDDQDMDAPVLALKGARMAIRWRGGRGVMALAEDGPTKNCQISAAADIPSLRDITAVFDIKPEAWEKWNA